jgi:hypothetical protein
MAMLGAGPSSRYVRAAVARSAEVDLKPQSLICGLISNHHKAS